MSNWKEQFIKDNPPKDGIGLIPLTDSKVAIVDEDDYNDLLQFQWSAKKDTSVSYEQYYAYGVVNGKRMFMHRYLLEPTNDVCVDHKNHKGWDNRRSNIRIVSAIQNRKNSRKPNFTKITSKYKGVGWNKQSQRWRASIYVDGGKKIHIGSFLKELEAAEAYNKEVEKYHGEYSFFNLA